MPIENLFRSLAVCYQNKAGVAYTCRHKRMPSFYFLIYTIALGSTFFGWNSYSKPTLILMTRDFAENFPGKPQ